MLKTRRIEYGWSIETPADLYGRYTRGQPAAVKCVYSIEEGFMPQDEKRRWVLARMYNLAPALFGLTMTRPPEEIPTSRRTGPVDLKEYQKTLQSYWKNGYRGTVEQALVDLGTRINSLHDTFPYSGLEQDQMKRLLCGYHMRRAEVAREVGYDKAALDHVNKAIILAKESKYADLSAAAHYRRGEIQFYKWNLQEALQDFSQAEKYHAAPPDILGRIGAFKGLALARMARTGPEMSAALGVVNESKSLIRPSEQEPICMLDFPQGQFMTQYIRSLLASPISKLHRPDEAEKLMNGIYREKIKPRLYLNEKISELVLTALISLDRGYHPIATVELQEALELIKNGRLYYLPFVEKAYEQLLESPYGKSVEVAELGLQLLVVQMPHLFK